MNSGSSNKVNDERKFEQPLRTRGRGVSALKSVLRRGSLMVYDGTITEESLSIKCRAPRSSMHGIMREVQEGNPH